MEKVIPYKKKRAKILILLYWLLSVILVFCIVYAYIKKTIISDNNAYYGTKKPSDYLLMIFECIFAALILFMPKAVEKWFKIEIPLLIEVAFIVFLFSTIVLGDVCGFYYKYKNWDNAMHFISGVGLGLIGLSLINIITKDNNTLKKMQPSLAAFFVFCFVLMIGGVWEICEFAIDGIFKTNMQKFMPEGYLTFNHADRVQFFYEYGIRYALVDTMVDLIIDSVGAFIIAIVGFFLLKYKYGKIEKLLIKSVNNEFLRNNQFESNQISIEQYIKNK